ncbi:hypothetical protein C1I92_02550 [Jiangella anatolica]|uniref:Phosphatidic acid phosphatase type 2/haloperoxidase domain-containing protein n=2 Tax=Jiangella anatolica TaxID=2670374 RepID=A0A2W2D0W4_9ACTN|nr:hypothetical protein C1I92_02550 [Jiangella anatolica]
MVIKYAVAEPRPPARLWAMAPDSRFSFPSGHTTIAAAVAVTAIFLANRSASRWTVAGAVVAAVFALLVAGSRVYLGVHYLTDVLASMAAVAASAVAVSGAWALLHARAEREGGGRGAGGDSDRDAGVHVRP